MAGDDELQHEIDKRQRKQEEQQRLWEEEVLKVPLWVTAQVDSQV